MKCPICGSERHVVFKDKDKERFVIKCKDCKHCTVGARDYSEALQQWYSKQERK